MWYPDDNKNATVRDVVFSGKFDRAVTKGVRGDDDAWLNEGYEREASEDDADAIQDDDVQEVEQQENADEIEQDAPEIE